MTRFMTVFLLAACLAGCGQEGGETPSRAETHLADRPAFDGAAARELVLTQVEFGPRVPGREGHQNQLVWMKELLGGWADTLEIQPLHFVTSGGVTLDLTNLLARFNVDTGHRILLLTHWDTRPWSDQSLDPAQREVPVPGANDGASGTAILLHLASLMAEDPPPVGVDLLFVDGEDYGPGPEDMFAGSRDFAENLPEPLPWAYALLLDMVGDRDPLFSIEAYSAEAASPIAQRIWRLAHDLGYGPHFPTQVGLRVMDDHVYLIQAGLPTVDIIDFEYGPGNRLWHTPEDTPENVSSETLGMVGDVVTELVYQGG